MSFNVIGFPVLTQESHDPCGDTNVCCLFEFDIGLPDPYVQLRSVVRQYPLTDLLDGAPATDDNIRHVSSEITAEILDIAGELMVCKSIIIILFLVGLNTLSSQAG